MKLIVQPRDSVICGHCSVAMVMGHDDANEVINRMGFYKNNRNFGSTFTMYYEYFKQNGIAFKSNEWPDNRKKSLLDISGKGVMSITDRGKRWGHAMAFEDGVIYDPGGRTFDGIAAMKEMYSKYKTGVKVFSIITILEEEPK